MKIIQNSLIVLFAITITSCSPDAVTEEIAENRTPLNSIYAPETDVVFIEELYYKYLWQEYGQESDIILQHQEYFDQLGALPKGCGPRPQPCDINPTGNCLFLSYQSLRSFITYSHPEELYIAVYNQEGYQINGYIGSENLKCPKKRMSEAFLETELAGCGYLEIAFRSEVTGSMEGFKLPFEHIESDCY